ncbi:MAG: methyltransferase domain-containing protein, partial [Elusimicrobiota bacterium]
TEFVDFAKMKNIQFDIITFFEVLEHQDNLQSFIQDITTLLKKDGFIAGSVPNRDRFLAKLSDRAFGFGDYPPHHFTRWSTEILKIYLEKNDFTDIWLKPCYFFSLLEASYWWQRVILGNFMNVARLKIKKFFSGDEQLAYLTMGEIIKNKEGNKKMHIFVGNFFKVINECSKIFEKATFLPLALITLRAMNRQGQSIYFKAKK